MAGYRLLIKPSAAKELESVSPLKDRRRLVERIERLSGEPRPRGCEKLSGDPGRKRIRQGDFRVLYAIDDQERTLTVVRIGHRRDVYR